jgi:hypothetical protein
MDFDILNRIAAGSYETVAFTIITTLLPAKIFVSDRDAPPSWRQSLRFSLYACVFEIALYAFVTALAAAIENMSFMESLSYMLERDLVGKESMVIVVVAITALIIWPFHAFVFYGIGKAFAKEKV